jgi:hypothetical protein
VKRERQGDWRKPRERKGFKGDRKRRRLADGETGGLGRRGEKETTGGGGG